MTVFHFLAAAAVLTSALACAILPFIAVWDRRLAVARRRSLYDKSAGQTESLTAVLSALFACAMGGDLLAGGVIDQLMAGPWRILWEGMVMISAFAALSSIMVLYAKRGLRNAFSFRQPLRAPCLVLPVRGHACPRFQRRGFRGGP